MKLSQKQIDSLYGFTKRHFVDWYDVQTELVDHLANAIETQWQNNKNLSFEEALKIEFKKFGIMGFSEIVEQKTNALDKHYRKLVWKYFIGYFKLPKIIITVFFVWILFLALYNFENKLFVTMPIACVLMMIHIYHLYDSSRKIKLRTQQTGKKWLFERTILQFRRTNKYIKYWNICPNFR